MAATKNCDACSDLQENSPEFVLNGVTDNVYNSIINDTGFNTASGHNDCTDLNNANDCLIGNMEEEVDSYDVCGWKEFMPDFIHNLWTTLKAIIAAICGMWTRIHKHDCEIANFYDGFEFNIGEDETDGSYVVAGKGVSFLTRSVGDAHSSDVRINYIGGALCRMAGGLEFSTANFDEPGNTKVWNFDNGDTIRHSYNRNGNSVWDDVGDTVSGNELIYEIRIKKSEYPQVKQLIGFFGQDANVGGFHCTVHVFNEGAWAYGQHGSCNNDTGAGEDGHDAGHQVPAGWIYVQLRMAYIMELVQSGQTSRKPTPLAFLGIRFNRNQITC